MHFRNLKNNAKVLQYVAPADAEAGTVNGAAVDTSGYEGVAAILIVDTVDADHTLTAKLQHGDAVATAQVTADEAELVAADSNIRPILSYAKQAKTGKQARVQLVRAGSNSSQVGWLLVGYHPGEAPVTQPG